MRCGFIGTGNMGGALATAVCRMINPEEIALSNRTPDKAFKLADELGCRATNNSVIAQQAKYIFLGVKPQMLQKLFDELRPILTKRTDRYILVSMAAGISMADIQKWTVDDADSSGVPVIKISPNTPVAIGEGIVLTAYAETVTPEEREEFKTMMSAAGLYEELPESLHAIGGSLSGCGPAFTDMYIEALADGAVACGMPRKQALTIAAQMVVGAGKLMLETGRHPGELKDAVCSPGGTTIRGVRALEERGFRGAAMDAVIAAYEKNIGL